MNGSRAVLITGCSSGIGRATAIRLARSGWTVYASARRVDSIIDLAEKGCQVLQLDVTSEASMNEAVAAVNTAEGGVGALVNNAGYSQSGAIERLPAEVIKRQFETNLFGAIRLAQLVLPGMRAQRWGRIVNMSSIVGRLTFPGGGAYHGTKHALEAMSDALRFEVAGFGIDVVVIEPGLIKTEFDTTAVGSIEADEGGPYEDFNRRVAGATAAAYARGPASFLIGTSDDVAKVVEKAISVRRPRTRYRVPPAATVLLALRRLLSDRAWDRLLARTFPRPG